jgi:hypothetical protein
VDRLATNLPLRDLWEGNRPLSARRNRDLSAADITALLHSGPVRFVVADVGSALRWVPMADCYTFWKSEAKPHVAAAPGAYLDGFPGQYCYFASEWSLPSGESVVILERHH